MATILIVDDDAAIGDMLETALKAEGYAILRAYSGTEALFVLRETPPDLVLLDLMLPGMTGEEVLSRLRHLPVIVVSAKGDAELKARLLLDGAADYVTKPFSVKELSARIQVALRRAVRQGDILCYRLLRMDTAAQAVTVGGTPVHLTRTEFAILKLLMQNAEKTLSKTFLLEAIAADTPDCTETSLKIHVSNLRRKLRDAGAPDAIEAVWGIGFKLAIS